MCSDSKLAIAKTTDKAKAHYRCDEKGLCCYGKEGLCFYSSGTPIVVLPSYLNGALVVSSHPYKEIYRGLARIFLEV